MTDYPDNPTEARKVVEQFLDQIEKETEWDVIDFDPYLDVYDGVNVQLKAELNPEVNVIERGDEFKPESLKELIERIENQASTDGAYIEDIIDSAKEEFDISRDKVEIKIGVLHSTGEIYEHPTDHYKVT